MESIKKILRPLIPTFIKEPFSRLRLQKYHKSNYISDYERYIKFSDNGKSIEKINLVGRIIKRYHSLEKGLTMPNGKLGFGEKAILNLVRDCTIFIKKYGASDEQVIHALNVIEEYKTLHRQNSFELNKNIEKAFNELSLLGVDQFPSKQRTTTKEDYFKHIYSDFKDFSNSRASVRNYSDMPVPLDKVLNAIELSQNAPSACNRQTVRVYIYTNPEKIQRILKIQGGNRGFGHLAKNLIVLTAELGVFAGIEERNQAFVDGGIFAMNCLYSLHYYGLVACILNCSTNSEKDASLRSATGIKDSEVFIAMIAYGYPVNDFQIALSKRHSTKEIVTIVE